MTAPETPVMLTSGVGAIRLRVLVIDPDTGTTARLVTALSSAASVADVKHVKTIQDARSPIREDVNSVYIDPISLNIDEASAFIFGVRREQPNVVFVLYLDSSQRTSMGPRFYAGERERFSHYYHLDKATPPSEFAENLERTVSLCQSDLYSSLVQDRTRRIQNRLIFLVRKAARNDSVNLPVEVLSEIQALLHVQAGDTMAGAMMTRSAAFLGPRATKVAADRCFVLMPYSQPWSQGVEATLKRACDEIGLDFAIAKTMDGRFVPHDIWDGITGSGVLIADLTGANANVTYEVGLADALGKDVLLLCQGSSVPFDFSGQRIIMYENTVSGGLSLQADVKARLSAIRKERDQRRLST